MLVNLRNRASRPTDLTDLVQFKDCLLQRCSLKRLAAKCIPEGSWTLASTPGPGACPTYWSVWLFDCVNVQVE